MGGFVTSTAFSAMQYAMDNAQRKAEVKTDDSVALANAQSKAEQIKASQAIDERTRQENLKRALATQRARFGAQGISAGGSSVAAQAALASDAAQESVDARNAANQQIQRINDEYNWSKTKNLLSNSYPANRNALSLMRQSVSGGLSLLDD
jgi:hypothetical protein